MQQHLDRILARAKRTFGQGSPEQAIAKTRAIIGPNRIPNHEKAAQSALDTLTKGSRPTAEELLALEFVIRVMRPAPLSQGGLLDPLATASANVYQPELVARWDAFRSAARPWISSVGRIDHTTLDHVGTGFLVRENIIATNRHVVERLTSGAGILLPDAVHVRFGCEHQAQEPPATKARVLRVLAVHPTLDIALLEIESQPHRTTLPLDLTTAIEDGHPVAVVGFPAASDDDNPLFGDAVFKGIYGVRRGAIGEVMDPKMPMLFHDCSTLGGNSGSPIVSLISHKVIGIHFSGWFVYRNEGLVAREVEAAFEAAEP